ncbi:MAG: hypothetical protein ACOYB2_11085 [Limnohabitans sp.]
MAVVVRHPYSPKIHESSCGTQIDGQPCGLKSYAAIHAPDEGEYRRRVREEKKAAAPKVWKAPRVPSSSKCKNCGYDLRGMYGSDRQAHKDGWCND